VIVGPTASGKSGLAMALARHVGGEVVSADSQQVYRGMDIGTGKVTAAEREQVPHHLIDIMTPDQSMTAQRFIEIADEAIASIASRGVPVIVAGGTMLYVRALLRGLFDGPPASEETRARLRAEAAGPGGAEALWQKLARVDPPASLRIDRNDLKRVIRALEVFELTGVPITEHQKRHNHAEVPPRYPARLVGLGPEREALYQTINRRVEHMFEQGLVDEVRALRAAGYGPELRSQGAIGYAETHALLDGAHDLDEAVRKTKKNSRRYARRQVSWHRGEAEIEWSASASDVDLDDVGRYLTEPDVEPRAH
jgi:tRNA dimethylallyltransferase